MLYPNPRFDFALTVDRVDDEVVDTAVDELEEVGAAPRPVFGSCEEGTPLALRTARPVAARVRLPGRVGGGELEAGARGGEEWTITASMGTFGV